MHLFILIKVIEDHLPCLITSRPSVKYQDLVVLLFWCICCGCFVFWLASWLRNQRKPWKHRKVVQERNGIVTNGEPIELRIPNWLGILLQTKKLITIYSLVKLLFFKPTFSFNDTLNSIQISFFPYSGELCVGFPQFQFFLSCQLNTLPLPNVLHSALPEEHLGL